MDSGGRDSAFIDVLLRDRKPVDSCSSSSVARKFMGKFDKSRKKAEVDTTREEDISANLRSVKRFQIRQVPVYFILASYFTCRIFTVFLFFFFFFFCENENYSQFVSAVKYFKRPFLTYTALY